jgi:type IV pilus biogenesis protein CpaD/CtpE
MKLQHLSFTAAIAVAAFTVGCATTGKTTTTAPPAAVRGPADAILQISGIA